jgi:hypothetical protein
LEIVGISYLISLFMFTSTQHTFFFNHEHLVNRYLQFHGFGKLFLLTSRPALAEKILSAVGRDF